jgi:DNA-binding NarL/FixJ family response regulator
MTDSIKILIVDDHPVVRDGLVAMLATQPDFDVVGQAAGGEEALLKSERHRPDVILLDLEMPGLDGVGVLKRIREAGLECRMIVFTAFDTDERILTAIQAGARGYLLKGAPRDELFHAIRIASRGGSLLQPIIASKLIQKFNRSEPEPAEMLVPLTPREGEVLTELARGRTNKDIAAALFITERTVKFHVSSIMGKIGAANRTEAVSLAAQKGLIDL